MKIRIVVAYVARYRNGHRFQFVPPVTGIHLAALVPAGHEVEVVHEQARPVPITADVDLVLLSFFSGFAKRAYEIADAYRRLGVKVVCGGPHASYWVEEALAHADAVVTGEAESVWLQLLRDAERGQLQKVYRGQAQALAGLPTPRYDLLESSFVVRRVLQATRGCPFSCSFCSVPDLNPGFRVRPIAEVVRDIATSGTGEYRGQTSALPRGCVALASSGATQPRNGDLGRGTSRFALPWQDKVVWFWDDNLLVKRSWAKELLRELRGLRRWWLTQASIDITKDAELLRLMRESGCIGIFLGIESFEREALLSVDKRQNQIGTYREAVARLHEQGICVMAGFISGFDSQTRESIVEVADRLNELEFDVPFLSILTPFRGTPLYEQLLAGGRILSERDWPYYNGYNVAFRPARMSPAELHAAHRALWRRAFSPAFVGERLARGARQLRSGAWLLSAAMNGFYGHKQLLGNLPADAQGESGSIAHPTPDVPAPLSLLAKLS